jgi:hypothetical protein
MFPTNGDLNSRVPPMQSNQFYAQFLGAQIFLAQISSEIRDDARVSPILAPARLNRRTCPQLAGHWNWQKKLNNYLNI